MKSREIMLELLKKPEAEVYVKIDGRIRKIENVQMCTNGFVVHPAISRPNVASDVFPEAPADKMFTYEFVNGVHRIVTFERGHDGIPCVLTVLEQSNIRDLKQFTAPLADVKFVKCEPGDTGEIFRFGVCLVKKIDCSVPEWVKKQMEEASCQA